MVGRREGRALWCELADRVVYQSGILHHTVDGHVSGATCAALESQRLAWGSATGAITVLTMPEPGQVRTPPALPRVHAAPVSGLTWLQYRPDGPGGNHLLSVSQDEGRALLWSIDQRRPRRCYTLPEGEQIRAWAATPAGRALLATQSGHVHFWETASGRDGVAGVSDLPTASFRVNSGSVIAIYPDWDNDVVYVWTTTAPWLTVHDLTTGRTLAAVADPSEATEATSLPPVTAIHLQTWSNTPTNRQATSGLAASCTHHAAVATGHLDGTARIWTWSTDPHARRLTVWRTFEMSSTHPITHVFADAYKLIGAALDGRIVVSDILTGTRIRRIGVRANRLSRNTRLAWQDLNEAVPAELPVLPDVQYQRRVLAAIWNLHRPLGRDAMEPLAPLPNLLPMRPTDQWGEWEWAGPCVDGLYVSADTLAVVSRATVHIFNMGAGRPPPGHPNKLRRGATDLRVGRTEAQRLIDEGLEEYEQEVTQARTQQAHRERLALRHTLTGLTEEEQLTYAMFLSADDSVASSNAEIAAPTSEQPDPAGDTMQPLNPASMAAMSEEELVEYVMRLSVEQR
ncbi:hypothetical protein IWQ60_008124 [Tieghemiomyces parasiticus]|uniref:Uncharacterized protein n=1 Tax=Tieghemiomyces parasiticus TaxID=78921 RepID=A0A9W8DNR6_9FUNG|nr:hypothetical protein IWQ60_008124 [Tieghemiomyces parasiticus]